MLLAATYFSFIILSIEYGGGGAKGATITLVGILIGAFFLDMADKFFPDTNLLQSPSLNHNNLRKIWLFALAITIHNFSEGFPVGRHFLLLSL